MDVTPEQGDVRGAEAPLLLVRRDDDKITNGRQSPLFTVTAYFMGIHFLLAFCEMILVAPLIQLFERSLCLTYYSFPSGGVGESMCKVVEIQRSLATIRGWKSLFDTLPVLLVAIPMGKLGDRYGPGRIMALALIGVALSLCEIFAVCAFPRVFRLEFVWLSSILLLCGGGLNASSAYMWAMASESIPSDRRSHAFYYIFSAFYIAELSGSSIASLTMDISPWASASRLPASLLATETVLITIVQIPCGLALASLICCLVLLGFMPDLRKSKSVIPIPKPSGEDESDGMDESARKQAVDGLLGALSNKTILLVIPVFLVGILRYTTLNILIQYANLQFSLKISTGARFYTETAIVNMALFLFLIPRITSHIRLRYGTRPEVIDMFLVRFSVCIMCAGCLCIGFAPSSNILTIGVFVFSSGFGSRVATLSLISYWISDTAKATLYSSIVVLESLGHAFGDPAMQQIFAASLRLPHFWHAMPFFVAAMLYGLAAISTSFLRIGKSIDESEVPLPVAQE